MHPVTHPFLARHADDVLGMLSGFDRLRLRGTLRRIANVQGMATFLSRQRVLLKDFREYVQDATARVKQATEAVAATQGRPVVYLARPSDDKDALAREIAARDRIETGLICVLKSVEPCWSFDLHRNRATKQLDLVAAPRKCLHYYHYQVHPQVGVLHTRLQSWFPFTVHVGLNGREWLARQLDAAGLGYRRRGNCFVWLEDVAATQRLAAAQLGTAWEALLTGVAAAANPAHAALFAAYPLWYYWSVEQSEWATDVLFKDARRLDALFPALVAHSLTRMGSRDVMRFLGKRVPAVGIDGGFRGEVVSDLAARPEGVRVKHRVNGNAVKMYNKQGSVLRVETVINQARDLRVYRPKEGEPDGEKRWRYLRKGVADTWRRAELSQQANERYLGALAAVTEPTPLGAVSRPVCRRVRYHGQPVRALNPLAADDAALLAVVYRGEFVITGLRNRDVRRLLYAGAGDEAARRRQAGRVTRQLRLLRAHRLLRKVPHTHRYVLTAKGRVVVGALLAAQQADTATLAAAA
jgi:hypothetical protein